MAKQVKLCRFAQRVDIPFSKVIIYYVHILSYPLSLSLSLQYQYCRSKGFFIEGFSYLIIKRGQRPPPLSEDESLCLLAPSAQSNPLL